MKKEIIILIVLLSTIALAADVPRERIVTTMFNITAISWIENPSCNPDTNETTGTSMFNLSINTEDKGNNNQILIGPVHELSNQEYSIMFIQWLSCEDILDNILLNNTVDMFSSCDGGNCKVKYDNCNQSKGTVEQNKADVDTQLAQCEQEKEECNGNLTVAKASAELLPNRDDKIKEQDEDITKLKGEVGQKWLFGLVGIVVGAIAYWLFFVRIKSKPNDRDERRAGRMPPNPSDQSWKEKWNKEEEELKTGKKKDEVPKFKL